MANSPQSKKRVRRNEKRTEVNKSRMSRIRTYVKAVENAAEAGDKEAAQVAFEVAEPELQRGVTKGVLHKGTASRKISRLAARVKAAGA